MPSWRNLAFSILLLSLLAATLLWSGGCSTCPAVPVLTQLSPDHVMSGDPEFTITLTGRHFHSATTLIWNGASHASQTVSDTRITATIQPEDIAAPGTIKVWVVNSPDFENINGPCGGGPSEKLNFTVE